ncbi:heat shock protein 70 family member [Cavenderia fasciculata]|uniref:Heat shock protein 70 family member n=1 Tax=Cavenderia fasciculata TaxID=261658 RepID=F4Q317_CACFS|nr:heat shock protein 70 family member [Cavenderia fasciculata]EGG17581.1 heat shock protein 70 family member [Cavenderia fasciculata]|eukprot:XP_004356065.1 heat shock protein 70 family member [Cavenderia fasciculata]
MSSIVSRRYLCLAVAMIMMVMSCLMVNTVTQGASVIGIDIGAQSFKIGLIKPGSFETVLNEQSGRKTPTQIGWFRDERVFASDAFNMWARNPKQVYSMFQPLLGTVYREGILEEIGLGSLGYSVSNDTQRNTFAIKYDDETNYSPEELQAMIFRKVKELASASTQSNVKECVIAVPPYLTQQQRQGVLDAASLAGLSVLSLINGINAASINFAMDRTFDKNTTAIFYDMGAKSTKLSLVQFSSTTILDTKTKKNKTTTHNVVKSMEWDENLGGIDFDMVIVNHLKTLIKKQLPSADTTDKKLTIKLIKEASKMKEMLSANQQAHIFIGSLIDEFDFSASISRKDFEDLSAPLFERSILPLQRLIESNGLTPNDIDFIELIGGCTRIPSVQQALKTYLKRDILDKHLNGDESASSGAAFFAAGQTHYFRVKDIRLKDITPYAVNVDIINSEGNNVDTPSTDGGADEETATFDNPKAYFFKKNNRINVKKTLSFSTTQPFLLNVTYPEQNVNIAVYNITSIPQASDSLNFTGKPKIHCSLKLNSNGMVVLERAEAEVTITFKKLKPKSAPATPSDIKKDEDDEDSIKESLEEDINPDLEKEEEEAKKIKEEKEKKDDEPVLFLQQEFEWITKTQRIPLNYTVSYQTVLPLSKDQISTLKQRLDELDSKDAALRALHNEKNTLESLIYDLRDKLEGEEYLTCSTSQERQDISDELDKASSWLSDAQDNDLTDVTEYQAQTKNLKKKIEKIVSRINAKEQLPKVLDDLSALVAKVKVIMSNVTKDLNITEEEVKLNNDKINTIDKWVVEKKSEYKVADFSKDLSFTSTDAKFKFYTLENLIKELAKKKRKPAPKKPTTTKTKDEKTKDEKTKDEKKEDKKEEEPIPQQPLETDEPKHQEQNDSSEAPDIEGDDQQNDKPKQHESHGHDEL